MKYNIGDKIKIITREVTQEDEESRLYFEFFGGLEGTVVKMPSEGLYAVDINKETLRPDFQKRHKEIEKSEKERWLAGLSEEAKRNMTAQQKQYSLAYTLLVKEEDLIKAE